MRKILVASLLLITILLSSCSNKTTATATPTTSTPTVEPTLAGAAPGQCQLSPTLFEPRPTEATYAAIGATDHILGPDTALMTILEYSDFT